MNDSQKLKRITDVSQCVFQLLKQYKMEKSCIDGSALLTNVLRLTGFTSAHPLTVHVMLCNPQCKEWLKTKELPKLNDEAGLKAYDDAGCASYQIGKKGLETGKDHWNGHLVVIVPNVPRGNEFMIDLTIVQAHRPDWGIHAPPLTKVVRNREFIKGNEPLGFLSNGTYFCYSAFPDDHSYLDGYDVFASEDLKEASGHIIAQLKSRGIA